MRVEIKIDRRNEKSLPSDGLVQIDRELKKRLNKKYHGTETFTRFATATDIVITGGSKEASKVIRKMVEEMFEEADEWLVCDEVEMA
ncbi:DinI family protein [Hafnia paralvei]|uniref:DinI-like family protein n=1 Tax=Hafnia paralvei TaxID=546367 RepID=UPI00076AF911|nr:DinI-like family protein [Hafnia paralvei]AMH18701.1 DinI family protein [Hafnia paralvei]TBM12107.1 DinI family protein [Hafnia paralvei]